MIPVIFFHKGEQQYLQSAINIALKKNRVIVIGNQSSSFKERNQQVQFFNELDLNQEDSTFRKVYKHMHSGEPEAQIICYTRWFAIKNLVKLENIDAFFHADSDLAILTNVQENYEKLNFPELALSTQDNQQNFRFVASGHSSYFTKNSIEKFCNFLLYSYNKDSETYKKLVDKHSWHIQNNVGGGVCDMTQLYLFSLTCPTLSLTKVNNDSCFDDNINSPENYYVSEYKMQNNLKKIILDDNKFYFENLNGQKILANTIHCQGGSKNLLFSIEKSYK
jgi:hypothetical protein